MARPKGYLLSAPAFRALLAANGITQRDVADRSGKSVTTISGLYRQDHRASAPTACSVAAAVGCEPSAIFPEMSGVFAAVDMQAAS
jgi:transcriptional regulator with XRE-family HTH domain